MFSDLEKELVKNSWARILPSADAFADAFYKRAFELRPDYRTLFPLDMSGHKRKFLQLLAFAVKSLNFSAAEWRIPGLPGEDLFSVALAMGRGRDPLYRLPRDAVQTFGEALVYALESSLQEPVAPQLQGAWRKLHAALELGMQLGSTCVGGRTLELSSERAQELCERALTAQLGASESPREQFQFSQGPP
ncbi:MAG TPA: hypothetical protein VG937_39315 [Polyangiaceae bacterium]|nr:hypothetical protein [Polyangiaceae bacterium]